MHLQEVLSLQTPVLEDALLRHTFPAPFPSSPLSPPFQGIFSAHRVLAARSPVYQHLMSIVGLGDAAAAQVWHTCSQQGRGREETGAEAGAGTALHVKVGVRLE